MMHTIHWTIKEGFGLILSQKLKRRFISQDTFPKSWSHIKWVVKKLYFIIKFGLYITQFIRVYKKPKKHLQRSFFVESAFKLQCYIVKKYSGSHLLFLYFLLAGSIGAFKSNQLSITLGKKFSRDFHFVDDQNNFYRGYLISWFPNFVKNF